MYGNIQKNIANILSISRIFLSFMLLFFAINSIEFIIIYIIACLTDIFDGFLARTLNSVTSFGSKIDSLADFIFVVVILYMILPLIKFNMFYILLIILIAFTRFLSMGVCYIKYKELVIGLHTYFNKLTGFVLSLVPILFSWINLDTLIIIVCIIALLSAIEELLINIKSKTLNRDIKSILE